MQKIDKRLYDRSDNREGKLRESKTISQKDIGKILKIRNKDNR